jgi:SHS family lactate transporter-like MFS transporter
MGIHHSDFCIYTSRLMTNQQTASHSGDTDHASAVFAGFLGWTLDAFDFFIVTLCVPAIAATYHVPTSRVLLTISLTLFMRPLGAFVFGLLADRYGRRGPMMINLVFYSCMSILSGLAPTYSIFLICRILFGIGMGGEWGVGASLAMEKVPPKLRGLLSGLLQEGYATGFLLASGAYFLIYPRFHHWQPLFWIGGAPALLAFFIRFKIKESAVWQKTKTGNWTELGTTLVSNWRVFFSIFFLMLMMNLASHGTQDIFPTFLETVKHFSPAKKAGVVAFSNVGAILGGVTVGMLSDRIGRRKAMIGSFILATLVIPLWAYAPSTAVLLLGAFLIQFMVQGAWGVIPAHISELSPDSVRGFLPGFAYQCGVAIAGFVSYFEDALKAHMSLNSAMAVTAVVVFPLAAIVVGLGKERAGVVFGEDRRTL